MRYVKALLLIAFFFVSMLFFVQNTTDLAKTLIIKLQILDWRYASAELPIYLLILTSFAVGAIVTSLYFLCDKLKYASALREEKARTASLQHEIAALKLPQGLTYPSSPSSPAAPQEQGQGQA